METVQKPGDTDVLSVNENTLGSSNAIPGDAVMACWRRSGFSIEIPVSLYAHEEGKSASYSEGTTVCVHANGALLAVSEAFEIGQWLLLINSETGQEFVCQVRFVRDGGTGVYHAGVEFVTAAPNFWGELSLLRDWDAVEPVGPQDPLATNSDSLNSLDGGPSCEPEPSATATSSKGTIVAVAKSGKAASFGGTGSRRSSRLPAEIPVAIRALEKDKKPIYVEGKAVIIGANGALLAVPALPKVGQLLHLTNLASGKAMVCKVRSVLEDKTGGNRVSIELAAAAPEFWGVTFPPDNRIADKR